MTPFSDGVVVLHPAASFLAGRGANYTSQFGEDGLIAGCLEKFGAENKWCFEVGAADGYRLSNTARLRSQAWTAVLIESDEKEFARLREINEERAYCFHEKVNGSSLDRILEVVGAPKNLDLGVIDIDGQDYWVWEGMRRHRPRLMLVEFWYTSEGQGLFVPNINGDGQASYTSIINLGIEKNYTALAKTHCNILFCDTGLL